MPDRKHQMLFGYYPHPLSIVAGDIEIEPLPGLDSSVSGISTNKGVDGDWLYAPLQLGKPYTSRVFGLPKTHVIRHATAESGDHITFLVWCLSFFVGMRLTTTEMGYLDATPISPARLVDFHASIKVLAKLLSIADEFWMVNGMDQEHAKRLTGAIHALFLAQCPQSLQFEKFLHLYSALDTCFALAKCLHPPPVKRVIHAERIDWMCGHFGMPTPDWAVPDKRKTVLSEIRNKAIHEALYSGEPFGFALHGDSQRNMTVEMEALVCRLIVALIGASSAEYIKTPVNTRQYQSLDL